MLLKILLLLALPVSALAQVSIGINQPGFYGRIDIGGFPQPMFVYPEPVIIMQPPYPAQYAQTIYLHVPPGHQQNWRQYCHRYNACNQRVYFVQDRWVREVYEPRHREREREWSRSHQHSERDRDTARHSGRDRDDRGDRGHGKGRD